MKKIIKLLVCLLFLTLLWPQVTFGADFIIKYYIYTMKTPKDRDKVVSFISGFEGVQKVETRLDRHWVYVYLEDDVMQDERFKIRVPLGKLGYPVERWEVQLEKPNSHD